MGITDKLRLVYACSEESFWSADGSRISHVACGGVMDGEWTVYAQNLRSPPFKPSAVRHTLSHVLSPVVGPISVKRLKAANHIPFDVDERVRWGLKQPCVTTPSVFNKGNKVDRFMSIEELMDAYDVELNVQSQLKEFWKREDTLPSRGFMEQIPSKVLRDLGSRIVESFAAPTVVINNSETDSDATVLHVNHNRLSVNEVVLDIDTISIASGAGEQAARPDDAEAETEDWDRWMVEKFVLPTKSRPLVCTGKYHGEDHSRLFDAMQKLLILCYCKNVTLSLIKYLSYTCYPGKRCKVLVAPSVEVNVNKWATVFARMLRPTSLLTRKWVEVMLPEQLTPHGGIGMLVLHYIFGGGLRECSGP